MSTDYPSIGTNRMGVSKAPTVVAGTYRGITVWNHPSARPGLEYQASIRYKNRVIVESASSIDEVCTKIERYHQKSPAVRVATSAMSQNHLPLPKTTDAVFAFDIAHKAYQEAEGYREIDRLDGLRERAIEVVKEAFADETTGINTRANARLVFPTDRWLRNLVRAHLRATRDPRNLELCPEEVR